MKTDISTESTEQIKKSYFNLLTLFLQQESLPSAHVRCLIKWGVQLEINPDDLTKLGKSLEPTIKVSLPVDKVEQMETLYHLVYMIHLDAVVEDVELEVASIFAEKLGFSKSLAGDLFKSIATAKYDNSSLHDVRKEVIDFLKIHEA
jgi:hypothetical protein